MTKDEIAKEYLRKMCIEADALFTVEETLHILKTKPPMPYFRYNASELMRNFFSRKNEPTCTGLEFANCLAARFLLISKRARHEQDMERHAARRSKNHRIY